MSASCYHITDWGPGGALQGWGWLPALQAAAGRAEGAERGGGGRGGRGEGAGGQILGQAEAETRGHGRDADRQQGVLTLAYKHLVLLHYLHDLYQIEHSECCGSSIFNLFWIPWVSWRSLQGTEDDLLASFSFATTFKVLGLLLLHSQSNNMFFLLQLHNLYCGMLLVTNGNKYPIKSLVLLSAILQWETSDMIGCEAREDLGL